jgi:hypothetical protein
MVYGKDVWIEIAERIINQSMYESHWSQIKLSNRRLGLRLVTQLNQMFSSLYTQIALDSIPNLVHLIIDNKLTFDLVWIRNSFKQVLMDFKIEHMITQKTCLI